MSCIVFAWQALDTQKAGGVVGQVSVGRQTTCMGIALTSYEFPLACADISESGSANKAVPWSEKYSQSHPHQGMLQRGPIFIFFPKVGVISKSEWTSERKKNNLIHFHVNSKNINTSD